MEFTSRAKQSFRLAADEVQNFGHPCVGSQHLVLGLFLLGNGVQFWALRQLGLIADALRQTLAVMEVVAEQTQTIGGFVFGSSAAHALEGAYRDAAAMSHTYTGTEHILLGLLSEEAGGAATLFAAHNVDTAKARQAILDECKQA